MFVPIVDYIVLPRDMKYNLCPTKQIQSVRVIFVKSVAAVEREKKTL